MQHVAPHAVGRGLSASTSPQVSGTGFKRSWLPRSSPVPRVPRAFRPVEYRPTANGAHAAQRGLGAVVLWANAEHVPPHAVGRGSTTSTSRQVGGKAFEEPSSPRSNPVARVPCAFRPVEYRLTAHGTRAAQRGLGVVALWANVKHVPPHAAGRGLRASTPRQASGTGFERS